MLSVDLRVSIEGLIVQNYFEIIFGGQGALGKGEDSPKN
jgi:hypothetical protein